ncbi:pali-domain-containing protein [Cyathus striatus]|nr:pali-domain-containing protein [Cyathus striatus]
MPRAFCIPGAFFLFCAFVLLFITSISLPYLPALDFARTHFGSNLQVPDNANALNQIRFGIWAPCYFDTSDARTCPRTGHAYSVQLQGQSDTVNIAASWTRGLVIHPVAAGVTFIALLLSLSTHVTVTLVASLVSFLAATITLIAFACDIALLAWVKHQFNKLDGSSPRTITGPGFWLTFASFILLLLAGCTVCFGRRRDRMAGATPTYAAKRPFWSRFRRTPKV